MQEHLFAESARGTDARPYIALAHRPALIEQFQKAYNGRGWRWFQTWLVDGLLTMEEAKDLLTYSVTGCALGFLADRMSKTLAVGHSIRIDENIRRKVLAQLAALMGRVPPSEAKPLAEAVLADLIQLLEMHQLVLDHGIRLFTSKDGLILRRIEEGEMS